MKVPIFKAHGDDIDRDFKGFYFAMPRTTYCIDSDYRNCPVKIIHCIAFDAMTDWGLPNQPKIATIDPSTLVQVGYVDTDDVNYIPREWIKGFEMKEYECIKPFSVLYYDVETDSYDETKVYDIEVGSIWQQEDYSSGSYTGADIRLDGDNGWIEINEEDLKEYFKEL